MIRLFTVFLFFSSVLHLFSEEQWREVKKRDKVTVYEKEVGDLNAFRAIGIIEGSPRKLVGIILNESRWKHWIEDLKSVQVLEERSSFEKVFHQVIDSPFPASNRDLVFECKVSRTGSSHILVEMKSIEHKNAPKSKGVRGRIIYSRYLIEPLEGNQMKVIFENLSDPLGRLPNFLVNWASRSYPISLFRGLRREMTEINQKEAPLPE